MATQQKDERARYWREGQHKANGRKRITLSKLPPMERMLGGLRYNKEADCV